MRKRRIVPMLSESAVLDIMSCLDSLNEEQLDQMIDPIREEQSDSQSRSVRKGDLAEEKEEVDEQIGRMQESGIDYNELPQQHSTSHKRVSYKNKYKNKLKRVGLENSTGGTNRVPEKQASEDRDIALDSRYLALDSRYPALDRYLTLDKKLRNKLAAKDSRERKRRYIELLEGQIKQMELELSETNRLIQSCKVQIQKGTLTNNQYIGEFTSKLQHVYRKLEKLVEGDGDNDIRGQHFEQSLLVNGNNAAQTNLHNNTEGGESSVKGSGDCSQQLSGSLPHRENESNNEINLCIDSICYRVGATGKQRKYNINQSYKQIFNLTIPSLHRYLLWSASERTHIFSDGIDKEAEKWFKLFREHLKAERQATVRRHIHSSGREPLQEQFSMTQNQPQKQRLIEQKRGQLVRQRGLLVDLVRTLCQIKQRMQRQGIDLDNLFLEVRQLLTPQQGAKFILFIEKYKYRDELRDHERIGTEYDVLGKRVNKS